MVDKCVCCGEIVPEGLMVCPVCERQAEQRKNRFIFVCSPLRGNTIENIHFAIERCREIALLGFIPIAPHLYFTRFLRDENERERQLGITYGKMLLLKCAEVWVFGNRISDGMKEEIAFAELNSIPVIYKTEAIK